MLSRMCRSGATLILTLLATSVVAADLPATGFGGWGGAYGRAVMADRAPATPGPACAHCLPYRTPTPCGVGPSDCCINLPYTGFRFYGTDPSDDDPINHTWTTCVGDMGNHAVRKTTRHVRRWGY